MDIKTIIMATMASFILLSIIIVNDLQSKLDTALYQRDQLNELHNQSMEREKTLQNALELVTEPKCDTTDVELVLPPNI